MMDGVEIWGMVILTILTVCLVACLVLAFVPGC